jgi:hypothetical protein
MSKKAISDSLRDVVKSNQVSVTIKPPNFKTAHFKIVGTAPLVIHKFSKKTEELMQATQEAGQASKSKKERTPKDFEECYNGARHISKEGWDGIHAGAFRSAFVRASSLTSVKMTIAKMAIFIKADGIDVDSGTPLVKINGDREMHIGPVRLSNGSMDLRARPMYREWNVNLTVTFDADLLNVTDISNLLMRVGMQVGIGEGRPMSKDSCGCGWGTFSVETSK